MFARSRVEEGNEEITLALDEPAREGAGDDRGGAAG